MWDSRLSTNCVAFSDDWVDKLFFICRRFLSCLHCVLVTDLSIMMLRLTCVGWCLYLYNILCDWQFVHFVRLFHTRSEQHVTKVNLVVTTRKCDNN